MGICRRHYPREQKLQIVKEAMETGNCALVARRYDISPNLVSRWTREYRRYGADAFTGVAGSNNNREDQKQLRALIIENERLKRMLGEKDLEIAILKDLLKKTNRN